MKQELDVETNKSIESHLATLKTKFNEILHNQNSECEKLEAETELQHKIKTTELERLREEKLKFIGEDVAELKTLLQIDNKNAIMETERKKLVSELDAKKLKFETEIVELELEVKNLENIKSELQCVQKCWSDNHTGAYR